VGAIPPAGPPPSEAQGPSALLAGSAVPKEADETFLDTTLPRGAADAKADEAMLDTALQRQAEVTDLLHAPQGARQDGVHNHGEPALQHIDICGDRSASSLHELAAALDAGLDAVAAATACA